MLMSIQKFNMKVFPEEFSMSKDKIYGILTRIKGKTALELCYLGLNFKTKQSH